MAAGPSEGETMKRPKLLFFDVNESLLDLAGLKKSVGGALGGRDDLLPLWFKTMLHYSLVSTVTDQYHDFGILGAAALQTVARNEGIELSESESRAAIAPIRSLPPHPDVAPALQALKEAGFRLATLTNSSNSAVADQMKNAGLTDFFEERLSVEDVQMFKPHPHTYKWATNKMNVAPEESMLVAAHGWDIAGALNAGMRGAFIDRPGAQLYPPSQVPEIIEPDLIQISKQLIAMNS
ncbi:Haloacetate dehalogenase H-2 [Planctomycetes bacterium FF15]|uniref:Haloacetate dehalogenase H-2 n=2 Tax=Bremerella alba TaxID=980252 RepID=A0A7V8V7T5_9BACT|nr:Haloacetate dehalogenase H-2 [Bremerella alba]